MLLRLAWQSCWHPLLRGHSYVVALLSGRTKTELQLPNVLFVPSAALGSVLGRWPSAEKLFAYLVPERVWRLLSIRAGLQAGSSMPDQKLRCSPGLGHGSWACSSWRREG